jgi:hypothetical protein
MHDFYCHVRTFYLKIPHSQRVAKRRFEQWQATLNIKSKDQLTIVQIKNGQSNNQLTTVEAMKQFPSLTGLKTHLAHDK